MPRRKRRDGGLEHAPGRVPRPARLEARPRGRVEAGGEDEAAHGAPSPAGGSVGASGVMSVNTTTKPSGEPSPPRSSGTAVTWSRAVSSAES